LTVFICKNTHCYWYISKEKWLTVNMLCWAVIF